MDDRAFFKVEKIFGSLQSFRFFWKDFWLTTIFSVFVENIFGSLKSFQFFLSTYIILIVLLNSVNLSRKKEFPFEVFFNFWKDWNEQKKALLKILCFQEKSWKDWLNDQKIDLLAVQPNFAGFLLKTKYFEPRFFLAHFNLFKSWKTSWMEILSF